MTSKSREFERGKTYSPSYSARGRPQGCSPKTINILEAGRQAHLLGAQESPFASSHPWTGPDLAYPHSLLLPLNPWVITTFPKHRRPSGLSHQNALKPPVRYYGKPSNEHFVGPPNTIPHLVQSNPKSDGKLSEGSGHICHFSEHLAP